MSPTPSSQPYEFSEADTCREYVPPAIQAAGWGDSPFEIAEQRSFTDGRIVLTGRTAKRREGKCADYLLRYRRDLTLAVVEAKPYKASVGDGLQQAKGYAEILGLKFAYAINGREIIEFGLLTCMEPEFNHNPAHLACRYPAAKRIWSIELRYRFARKNRLEVRRAAHPSPSQGFRSDRITPGSIRQTIHRLLSWVPFPLLKGLLLRHQCIDKQSADSALLRICRRIERTPRNARESSVDEKWMRSG